MIYDYGKDFENPRRSARAVKRWYRRWWGILIIIVFVCTFIISVFILFYILNLAKDIKSGQIPIEEFEKTPIVTKQEELTAANHPFLGAQDAQATIFEFIDYACPDCSKAQIVLEQLLADPKYGNQVKIVYYHFPIVQLHDESLKAAMAAQCAYAQGNFEAMHKKLLENQDKLSIAHLKLYSIQLGLDSIQFSNCLDSNTFADLINDDYGIATRLGITSAPTFFIGSQKFPGVPDLFTLQQSLDVLSATR